MKTFLGHVRQTLEYVAALILFPVIAFGIIEPACKQVEVAEKTATYGSELNACDARFSITKASHACIVEASTQSESKACRARVEAEADEHIAECQCEVNKRWERPCFSGGDQ